MLSRVRFSIYRRLLALLTWLGFRSQRVEAIQLPIETAARYRPFAESFPQMPVSGLFDPLDFPAADLPRLKRIKQEKRLLRILRRIAPATTPPVPDDEGRLLALLYPGFFRRAWSVAPRVAAALHTDDVIAALAVEGPFASYLRADPGAGTYAIDVSWMLDYEPHAGLLPPGGKAVFEVRDGRLRTIALQRNGEQVPLTENRRLLAALSEDLTTFRHNISLHLATLTSFALASTNHLATDHPIRRLLHPCFHTVLIGNREVSEQQLSGPLGFAAKNFSHDAPTLARMITDHLTRYDIWDFEPETQFARRGTTDTPFAYPYRDNVLELWRATHAYVDAYLRLYFPDDRTVSADASVSAWLETLDRLLPNGVSIPSDGVSVAWLARLCATLIHVSSVEHDYLNNVVWDYAPIGSLLPQVVPASGERMDQRRGFDLVATLIGTWKPYNMLLTADVPSLALDGRARQVMTDWITELQRIQASMPAGHPLSYPANLNVSISN